MHLCWDIGGQLLLLTSSELPALCSPYRLTLSFSVLVRPEEQVLCGEPLNEVGIGEGCPTRHMMVKPSKPTLEPKVRQLAVGSLSGQ